MKYVRFERLALVVGTVAILATLLFSFESAPTTGEIFAQLFMIPVLVGAVHWGRKGGFIAATIASLAYIVIRIPMVTEAEGLELDILLLILSRVIAYGLVGIVGGELCARIMYVFAKIENTTSIDDWSGVYNQRFIGDSLKILIGQHQRYGTPCSAVVIQADDRIFVGLRTSKQRQLVRHMSSHLRNDIRLVDEVGRLDDGRFLVLLPQTPLAGGAVVGERLLRGIRDELAAKDESVSVVVHSAPENLAELESLRDEICTSTERVLDASPRLT